MLVNAAPFLNRERFDYEIAYFLPWKNALHSELESAGLNVTCLSVSKMFDPRSVLRLRKLIRSGDYDLLHSHLPWSSVITRTANKRLRLPHVYTEHGRWERLNRITRLWNRRTIRSVDATIAVSNSVADSMVLPTEHDLHVIENGIDPSPFIEAAVNRRQLRGELGIPHDQVVLLSVANLSPVKGHELLVDALPSIAAQTPNVVLMLAGQTRGRDELLLERARNLGVEKQLQILGPRDDIPHLLGASDISVISSHSEGLPVSLLEAMASSTPVVSTCVGGIPRVIEDGKSGLLISTRDPEEFATAVSQLASDSQLRASISEDAFNVVTSRFHVKKMVSETEAIYDQLLNSTITNCDSNRVYA